MKGKIIITGLWLCSLNCYAQNNPIFYGGQGDGINSINYTQSSSGSVSLGGTGDGWSKGAYHQAVNTSLAYYGGIGDGVDKGAFLQGGTATMAFSGGYGDGWSTQNYMQQGSNMQFFGGNGDGWHSDGYSQTHDAVAFRGGVGDGWASSYTPLAPLPITFLKFEATKKNTTAYLNWQLAKDDDVKTFEVERSANAVAFEKIGLVMQNTANNKKYDFTDAHPLKGNNYYRIKIINKNGKEEYTGTKVVNFEDSKAGFVKIYPNPASSFVNIEIPADYMQNENTVINVYSMNGAMVYQQKMSGISSPVLTINISNLTAGSYVVHIASANQTATGKFIVTK